MQIFFLKITHVIYTVSRDGKKSNPKTDCWSCRTAIHSVHRSWVIHTVHRSCRKHEKTATEQLLLRFRRGATGNRTRDTRIFSPLLYQLSYGTKFLLRTTLSFDWDCKGRHFFFTSKLFLYFLLKKCIFCAKSDFFVSSQEL